MEKGTTNNPAGRPKGLIDKRNLRVAERAEEMGCDPIEFLCLVVMADVARLKEAPDLNQRIACAKELATYIAPKLKAIELTGGEGSDLFAKFLKELSGPK